MANIPVERTDTGVPPWLWLVGLLLLGLLAWFLFETLGDDDEVAVVDDTEVVATPVADAFDMSDVYVTRVVGDNTFFVAATPDGTDERLVYLEEEPTPGDATEGRYDVTEGQNISITGSMEPTPADLTPWGLTDEQAGMVGDQYIRATSLTILGDAMADDDMADADMDADAPVGLAMLDGDLASMAGQAVALDGVRVTGLTGDSTFAVGEGATRTVVVLESLGESESGPGDGSDGAFDVNDGDTVSINGTIRAFQRGMRGTSDMTEADQAAAEARRYVIVVNGRDGFSKQ